MVYKYYQNVTCGLEWNLTRLYACAKKDGKDESRARLCSHRFSAATAARVLLRRGMRSLQRVQGPQHASGGERASAAASRAAAVATVRRGPAGGIRRNRGTQRALQLLRQGLQERRTRVLLQVSGLEGC